MAGEVDFPRVAPVSGDVLHHPRNCGGSVFQDLPQLHLAHETVSHAYDHGTVPEQGLRHLPVAAGKASAVEPHYHRTVLASALEGYVQLAHLV